MIHLPRLVLDDALKVLEWLLSGYWVRLFILSKGFGGFEGMIRGGF